MSPLLPFEAREQWHPTHTWMQDRYGRMKNKNICCLSAHMHAGKTAVRLKEEERNRKEQIISGRCRKRSTENRLAFMHATGQK